MKQKLSKMVFKAFLDINILLDFFLKRDGFPLAERVLKLAEKREIDLYISVSILQTSAYFLQKYYGPVLAKKLLTELLLMVNLIDSDKEVVIQALNSSIDDIEDAVHYYTAMKHDLGYLITRDTSFQQAKHQGIQVIDPERFIRIFK
ncbi:PIN domain protein [compost metagenome]